MKIEEIILTALVTAFFASIIPRKLNERQKFIEGAIEFRKVFMQTLVDIRNENVFFDVYSIDTDSFKKLEVAYLTFRYFLKGTHQYKYDEAWNQYCFDCKHHWDFDSSIREKVEKDIERLLEFTEYSLFQSITI